MILNILLTEELKATMPETIKITHNFCNIDVIFDAINPNDEPLILNGDNVVVEGSQEEIIKWFKPFDGVPIGSGSPRMENFTIMHIKDNL
jgi:hypothetical protein